MRKLKTPFMLMLLLPALATAQTVVDVQFPLSITTTTYNSGTNPADYVFSNTENVLQGINIYLAKATSPNRPEIFMQQNNVRLAVNLLYTTSSFSDVEVNYDNMGYVSVYHGSNKQNYGWFQPPAWWATLGTVESGWFFRQVANIVLRNEFC